MFTGLITDLGVVRQVQRRGDDFAIVVATAYDIATVELGESIAIDGACLTVVAKHDDAFEVQASTETLEKTTLGDRKQGERVHLERALAVGDRLGGHFVLGHVDGVGTVRKRSEQGNAILLEVEAPEALSRLLIDKGSVAVDGVSLTVNWVRGARFGLAIIPFTTQETNLGDYRVGRRVNLEGDVLGKYVQRFVQPDSANTADLLAKFGFGDSVKK